uniref:Uncharacterized protein n=1 Tax=Psilocybe cubensis TaxID=181762 RepID=A0A8H7XTT0_PSICU
MPFVAMFQIFSQIFLGSRRSSKPILGATNTLPCDRNNHAFRKSTLWRMFIPSAADSNPHAQAFLNSAIPDHAPSRICPPINSLIQGATTWLKVIKPICTTVPIAGSPIKGIIKCLLEILTIYEQSKVNQHDIAGLKERLGRLDRCLEHIQSSQLPSPYKPDDFLRRSLRKTLSEITAISRSQSSIISTRSVEKTIKRCTEDVNQAILDCMMIMISDVWVGNVGHSRETNIFHGRVPYGLAATQETPAPLQNEGVTDMSPIVNIALN